ncbi:MAG: DUF3078 domain-containing protein [Bacteroidales bacterium]|nr:DUF3078 domain-containing protein [Bacteroidales bacterium]
MKKLLLILLLISFGISLYGQLDSVKVNRPDINKLMNTPDTIIIIEKDTILLVEKDTIYITNDFFALDTLHWNKMMNELNDSTRVAVEYLMSHYMNNEIWENPNDPLRHALYRIAWYVINSPVDSTMKYLESYPFNNLNYSTFPKDTILQQLRSLSDSTMETQIDTVTSEQLLNISDSTITQQILADSVVGILADSTIIHIGDSLRLYITDTLDIPFLEIKEPGIGDSLRYAVNLLIEEIRKDSMMVWMMNLANDSTNVWVNKKGKSFSRFWLKNEVMDSIGLWVENVGRKGIKLTLDDGVYFKKFSRNKKIDDFKFEEEKPDADLRKITPVVIKPIYWKFGAETGINFTQGYLSNWVKGGESSISALGNFTSFANFTKNKTKWENNFRFKYGLMKTGEKGLRKNDDLWEINTKFGQKAFGNLGRKIMEKHGKESLKNWYYSFLVSMKSQIAAGYNYPNDSVIVSSFMSPSRLFFALGLDYKPNKTTSILISPITSKSTIVRDTVNIDQTKYGLNPDRKIKSEMGGYMKAKFLLKINDDISLDNKLSLFTNYLKDPQNIDIDWEATLKMRINYYINANISTHLIYDDNIEVPLFNDEGTNIGSGPRTQFKELINVGFTFKFL